MKLIFVVLTLCIFCTFGIMAFELGKFVNDFEVKPTIEQVHNLKKTELLEVCKHYEINAKVSMKKAEVKQMLVEYFVDENVLPDSVLESVKVQTTDVELRKLELEHDMRLKEIALKEKAIEAELKIKEHELELEKIKLSQPQQPTSRDFDVSRNIRLVPPFNEKDIDKYFLHFEKVGENANGRVMCGLFYYKVFWLGKLRKHILLSVLNRVLTMRLSRKQS